MAGPECGTNKVHRQAVQYCAGSKDKYSVPRTELLGVSLRQRHAVAMRLVGFLLDKQAMKAGKSSVCGVKYSVLRIRRFTLKARLVRSGTLFHAADHYKRFDANPGSSGAQMHVMN